MSFDANPPKVEPNVLTIKFPTQGKDKDMVKFSIKNSCNERLTYKMKGTKTDKFKVVEGFGFVEPKASTDVELYPIEMKMNQGWSKFDYFNVIVGVAPRGADWDPREVWKKGGEVEPKQVKTLKIQLLTTVGKADAAAEKSGAGSSSGGGSSSGEGSGSGSGEESDVE